MSFYSDPQNISPGPIDGNALNGLRHRVAVNVRRVLDSCQKQIGRENTDLKLLGVKPGLAAPFKLLSATSPRVDAAVTDLRVTRLEERPSFARVSCNVIVPLKVIFADAEGTEHAADSQIVVPEDVILYVPEASVFPFEIAAVASANCTCGKFVGNNTFNVTACLTVITKVVAETDLLMPCYGFCPSPRAVDFAEQVCNGFFDLPLYPSGK